MKKISLIIPVYNVEKYIEECLISCLEQDISSDEYEIIIINDGTQDNSLNISVQYANKFKNISVYTQDNQGLSSARNLGLSLAVGKYVWFIDSDDKISFNCLNKITNKCINEDLDALAICSANIINDTYLRRYIYYSNDIFQGKDFMMKKEFQVCVPFTIYRRKFLVENCLKFFHDIFHEDSEFSPRSYYLAEKVSSLDDLFYFVNQNPISITRTINPKKSFDLIQVCNNLSDFSESILQKYKYKFDYLISMNLNTSLHFTAKMSLNDRDMLNRSIYENRHLFKHLRRSRIMKYKIEGLFFNLFPKKTIQIYTFLQNLFFFKKYTKRG